MRTLILVLAVVLLATPVWATVTITTEIDGANPKKVWIGYTSNEVELIRAFALDIVATDGNIVDVNEDDFAVGDDIGGFGIFPGTFASANVQVDAGTGEVVTWDVPGYSPVAPSNDPCALGGIGTPGVTIEMGSLYSDPEMAPPETVGVLCSVTVDDDVTELCVTANAIRGNVVLESAAEVQDLVVPDGGIVACQAITGPAECMPSDHPDYQEWLDVGKPDCWCYTRQCHGDADNVKEGLFIKRWVSSNDLAILVANWQVASSEDPTFLCSDFNHTNDGLFIKRRTSSPDLSILVANWQVEPIADDCCPGCTDP